VQAPDFTTNDPLAAPESGAMPSGLTEEGRPYIGQPDALVTFYEFADFQCPHCKAYTVGPAKDIKQEYVANGKARVVFVNFAFLGDESTAAARAGHCAAQQGKFWEMHDWLFANQGATPNTGAFGHSRLVEFAENLGLDRNAFDTCMIDPATADFVQADKDFGVSKSVNSTPSFLVGETLIPGGSDKEIADLRTALNNASAQ
jgi:protein-disulfide isomerase